MNEEQLRALLARLNTELKACGQRELCLHTFLRKSATSYGMDALVYAIALDAETTPELVEVSPGQTIAPAREVAAFINGALLCLSNKRCKTPKGSLDYAAFRDDGDSVFKPYTTPSDMVRG